MVQDFTVDSAGEKVDIIIVDDNSPSMEEKQNRMAKRFANFIATLDGLDWQLGIITTDTEHKNIYWQDGRLLPFKGLKNTYVVNASTPNVVSVFQNTVRRKEWGSDDERGVLGLLRLFQRPENRFMIRPNSHVVSIIVSDEDERSNQWHLQPGDRPENLIKYFDSQFGKTNTYTNHSLVFQKDGPTCPKLGVQYRGYIYEQLSALTGGVVGDICQPDYSATLKAIGDNVRQSTFSAKLECAPRNGVVNVTYSPKPPFAVTATVNGDLLTLNPYPPVGTKVEVTYFCQ